MGKRLNLGRGVAILACAASLAGTAATLAPGTALAAGGATSCGSKTITVAAKGGKSTQVAVSRISVAGGATCRQAYTVIAGVVTKEVPKGWTIEHGHFHVPHGLTAQVATKGAMTIKFALVGS